jgi:hypothetical protein
MRGVVAVAEKTRLVGYLRRAGYREGSLVTDEILLRLIDLALADGFELGLKKGQGNVG